MKFNDLKYLMAYLMPLAALVGLSLQGPWAPGSVYVAFVIIPVLEQFLPRSPHNLDAETEKEKLQSRFFDGLLYLNVPLLYGVIIYFFERVSSGELTNFELLASVFNVGLLVGTIGINVAHELGHRSDKREQALAKALLLSGLYMHFFIEHNRGHHKHVATPLDPASAVKGQPIYTFWIVSVLGGYRNAWRLEARRLQRKGKSFWSWHNEMLRFTVLELSYLALIGWIWGWWMIGFAIAIAVVGFLLLESVNYIEHYGLRRRETAPGRYEKVSPVHSWNSDHELGRIFLYELTRHSDHHYKASRKYQVLRHFEESPQLPLGYPASILLSLVPPLWFRFMDHRVDRARENIKLQH
jgi:alkane 1-monooxygenase